MPTHNGKESTSAASADGVRNVLANIDHIIAMCINTQFWLSLKQSHQIILANNPYWNSNTLQL